MNGGIIGMIMILFKHKTESANSLNMSISLKIGSLHDFFSFLGDEDFLNAEQTAGGTEKLKR